MKRRFIGIKNRDLPVRQNQPLPLEVFEYNDKNEKWFVDTPDYSGCSSITDPPIHRMVFCGAPVAIYDDAIDEFVSPELVTPLSKEEIAREQIKNVLLISLYLIGGVIYTAFLIKYMEFEWWKGLLNYIIISLFLIFLGDVVILRFFLPNPNDKYRPAYQRWAHKCWPHIFKHSEDDKL